MAAEEVRIEDDLAAAEGPADENAAPASESAENAEQVPERVGFRGWLRGTAQKGLSNVMWTAGNAKALAGQGLSQVLHRGNPGGFKDYESLATHLEKLVQSDKGKGRIESVSYLTEVLKSRAPNYESLTQTTGTSGATRLSMGDADPPVLAIADATASPSPSPSPRKGGEVPDLEGTIGEPPLNLDENPLKSLADVSVPPPDIPENATEEEREKQMQGVREVFLSSKALELSGMALMKCKPASEWENVAYRELFQTSIFLDPQSREEYCESVVKTACKISEVWETVQMQSSEGGDSGPIKEAIEKLMDIVCATMSDIKFEPKIESIRRKMDALMVEKPVEASPGKVDPFLREKESVRVARELCDFVEEQQRLVEGLTKKEEEGAWDETQKFLTVKTIEFTDELSSKSDQIKEAAEQKTKATKYRETKLNDLTGSLDDAKTKREKLMEREIQLLKELENVRSDIVKENSHVDDLTDEIKLVEESSAEVIGSLTFAESELKVKHNILTASLKAMDAVQDFFTDYTKKNAGWSNSHKKALIGLANSDSHQSAGRLFRVCVSHLELCVQEGDRLLQKIKFCDNELTTMRERAVQMQTLGLMDGEEEEEEVQGHHQDFSFVEEGIARIQAQHDKASAQLETVIDDGLKTQAILDSEGIRDTSQVKLKMLIDRMNDFSVFLSGTRAKENTSASLESEPQVIEDEDESAATRDVKADENNAEEYIEYLEQKLNPPQSEYQVMLNSESEGGEGGQVDVLVAGVDADAKPEDQIEPEAEAAAQELEEHLEGEDGGEGEEAEDRGASSNDE